MFDCYTTIQWHAPLYCEHVGTAIAPSVLIKVLVICPLILLHGTTELPGLI